MRYNKLLHLMLSLFLLSFSVSLIAGIISIKSNVADKTSKLTHHESVDVVHRLPREALSDPEITEILNAHNNVRMLEGAANMDVMEWNTVLAALALNWSNNCVWITARPNTSNQTWPFNSINQIIYATTAINLTAAVNTFYDEKQYYTFSTGACQSGQPCGVYTQVVWATTYALGCAYTLCSTLYGQNSTGPVFFIVCNYGPGGNYNGIQPYIPGPACTECQSGSLYCNNGLCSLPSLVIPVIDSLSPDYGPIAGGTNVTLLGKEFGSSNSTPIVYFGDNIAAETHFVNSNTIIVLSPPSNETCSVTINFNGFNNTASMSFQYKGNPQINGFNTSTYQLISGGSVLTVIGSNLDSVANPQINATVVITQLELIVSSNSYYQNCIFTLEDLYCPLPNLSLPLTVVSKIQFDLANNLSSTTVTPGDVATIYGLNNTVAHIGIGFVFDGYKKYSNITDAEAGLQGLIPILNLITPPVINGSNDVICSEPEPLLIPGEYLSRGCVDGGVVCQVSIGNEECTNLMVTENDLICYPPKVKPQPSGDEIFCVNHPNTLTVMISIGQQQYDYRCLDYCNNLNVPLIVGLSAGLGGAFVICILVVLIIVLCQNYRRRKERIQQRSNPFRDNSTREVELESVYKPRDNNYLDKNSRNDSARFPYFQSPALDNNNLRSSVDYSNVNDYDSQICNQSNRASMYPD